MVALRAAPLMPPDGAHRHCQFRSSPHVSAMLISLRRVSVLELDVTIVRSILRHPAFVVRLAEYRGSVVEDRLFAASAVGTTTVPHWPVLALALAGSSVVRHERTSTVLHRGELLFAPSGASFSARSSPLGARVWV